MQISDVRVKLINVSAERLKAVCTVTFDEEFVVRDVKVVDGTNGLFVAMPSRKLSVHCPACKHKNHLRARFCNECGAKVPPPRAQSEDNGRSRLHRDIAHPITAEFREVVQQRVIEAYLAEVEKAGQPGYEPTPLEPDADAEPVARAVIEEPEEPVAELSEYDAMIAALRGSGPDDGADRAEHGRDDRRDRGPAPERGNARSDRGRDRGSVRRESADRGNRAEGPPRRDAERPDGRRGDRPHGNDSRRNAPRRQDAPVRQAATVRQDTPVRPEPPVRREPAARSETRPPVEERPRTERVAAPSRPAASPAPAPTARPAPVRSEPKPQPIVAKPIEEDDGGFGQGIL